MAAKTVREIVALMKVESRGAMKNLAQFGLAVDGVKAGLEILINTYRVATEASFGFVKEQTAQLDAIAKSSRAMGVNSKVMQRMGFAAERSGVPLVNFTKASQNLARNMRDAALAGEGKGSFNMALKEVGLTAKELIGLNFEERLGLIGEALQTLPTEAAKVAAAQKLIGEEAGPKFMSFLKEGRDGLKALGDEAERLGLVMSDDTLAAAEAYQDSLTNLDAVLSGLKRTVAGAVAPAFGELVDDFRRFIAENRKLIKTKAEKFMLALAKVLKGVLENGEQWIEQIAEIISGLVDLADWIVQLTEDIGGLGNAVKVSTALVVGFTTVMTLGLSPVSLFAGAVAGLAIAFGSVSDEASEAEKNVKAFGKTKSGKGGSRGDTDALAFLLGEATRTGDFGINTQSLIRRIAALDEKSIAKVFGKADTGSTSLAAFSPVGFKEEKKVIAARQRNLRAFQELVKEERKNIALDERLEDRKASRASAFEKATGIDLAGESAHFDRLRRIGGKGGSSDAISEAELLKLIDTAAASGRSITDMIGNRKIEGAVPPVFSIRQFIFNIENNNENTFEGLEGESPEEFAQRINDLREEDLQDQFREALETASPAFVR